LNASGRCDPRYFPAAFDGPARTALVAAPRARLMLAASSGNISAKGLACASSSSGSSGTFADFVPILSGVASTRRKLLQLTVHRLAPFLLAGRMEITEIASVPTGANTTRTAKPSRSRPSAAMRRFLASKLAARSKNVEWGRREIRPLLGEIRVWTDKVIGANIAL